MKTSWEVWVGNLTRSGENAGLKRIKVNDEFGKYQRATSLDGRVNFVYYLQAFEEETLLLNVLREALAANVDWVVVYRTQPGHTRGDGGKWMRAEVFDVKAFFGVPDCIYTAAPVEASCC